MKTLFRARIALCAVVVLFIGIIVIGVLRMLESLTTTWSDIKQPAKAWWYTIKLGRHMTRSEAWSRGVQIE